MHFNTQKILIAKYLRSMAYYSETFTCFESLVMEATRARIEKIARLLLKQYILVSYTQSYRYHGV